ncbi:MAG: ankyrin repeat domain-containing protein [Gammaproteobacteria bacterium]|nr:ankyrin repeat domain-containing protein [Gammaproteobacteria bacterium]
MPRPYRALVNAVAAGDEAALAAAIERDPEAARHWKPIVDAAFAGRADMVRMLLEADADPNVISGTGSRHTPLTRVTQHHVTIPRHAGHVDVVNALLEGGADPDLRAGPFDIEPMAYAAMAPNDEFVSALRRAGATIGIHMAGILLDQGRLKDFLRDDGLVRAGDARGRKALDYVAWSGFWRTPERDALACATMLLEAGAGVDDGEEIVEGGEVFTATPLWRTLSWPRNYPLAELLLERGANPDNAVFTVTYHGAAEGCELLDRFGANWEHTAEGRTPLMDLMLFKKPGGSVWLIERGVDVRATDNHGKTALHYAAAQGVRADYVERLLLAGADPGAKDADGKTPLDYATQRNRSKLIDLLR